MIDNLNILYDVYSKQTSKVKELSNIMDMHYTVTSVIGRKVVSNNTVYGTAKETMDLYCKIKSKEFQDKIQYDCELTKFQLMSKQLIEEYKAFYDEAKKELSAAQYDRIKKLADDTSLATKIPAQTES